MAHSSTTNMTWSCLNTKEDLLNTFLSQGVDQEVIEMMIEERDNNLLLAYRDLVELTKVPDHDQSLYLLSDEQKSQADATTDTDVANPTDSEYLSKNETPTNRILYLVSRGYKVMVLMRGCPGSGKSYKAMNIVKQCYENPNFDEFIFSADKFFANKNTGHYCYNHDKLSNAHHWTQEKAQKAVQYEVTPVIIDNTNTKVWEMEIYLKLAVNNGYWIEILEPDSEWAWNVEELSKKNMHNVPYNNIVLMLQRYEHDINVEGLLSRFKLKYNRKNLPPIISKNYKKYQICKKRTDEIKIENKPQIDLDKFEDLHISQKPLISFNSNDDLLDINRIQEKEELPIVDKYFNLFRNVVRIDEDSQSTSSSEEASNHVNKSVCTHLDDFLFMQVLNEMPEETIRPHVIFGTNRDINERNKIVLSTHYGKLDKGTSTHDLEEFMGKLNLNELQKQFPENVCSLISELFDECKGNIEWIVDMLSESGYIISKQQFHSLIQFEENNMTGKVSVQDTIGKSIQNYVKSDQDKNLTIVSQNELSKTAISDENRIIEETIRKKKKHRKKMNCPEGQKCQIADNNLKKNIENMFVYDDSLYSDHVLKIKKFKENKSLLDDKNIKLESVNNDLQSIKNDTGFVQLVMDTSVLTQLCDYFGDYSSDLSKSSLQMSVKLPEKLAEDLYYCLIANVPTDIIDQEAILQDEFLARKLQEECRKECLSNIPNSYSGELTFAAVLSKKLLLEKFKNVDSKIVQNILRDSDYKFEEANDVLSKLSGIKCSTNQENPNIGENEKTYDNKSEQSSSFQNYQQQVEEHAHLKNKFASKANQSLITKMHPAVTAYYLEKKEESKLKEQIAKTALYTDEITQNENATSLDLHFLPVTEAIIKLNIFLDFNITNLKKSNGYNKGKNLSIITGRGKHSPKGIAVIKPAVIKKLQNRQLMFFDSEGSPGVIMVIIKKNSLLSIELD